MGRPSILFRAGWFLRSRVILLRRWCQQRFTDWRGVASANRARAYWSSADLASAKDLVWTRARVVREHLHEMVSGDPRCDWVTWMTYRYAVGTRLSALVLGCGQGWLERALALNDRIERVVGVDSSGGAIARAAELAAQQGLSGKIRYLALDLEHEVLPESPYDLVYAHDVIHHIRELEDLFDRVGAALAPAGVFLFCEYVGPRRFQYDQARTATLDEFLRALPDRYRRLPHSRTLATTSARIDPGDLARRDPSEAVRSDEILPVMRSRLKLLEEIPYGGSLLNPLLDELVVNFEDGNEVDEAILKQLCAAEKVLIRTGALPPDFVVGAASRKNGN